MSKVKRSNISRYELLYITSNKFSEDEVKLIVEKINQIIKDAGGVITLNQEWGKKRLIYPIKTFRFGYYSLVEFDLTGSMLAQIDKHLRMMSEILRHQIVVKKVKTAAKIAKDKKIADKITARGLKEEKIIEEKTKIQNKPDINLKELDEKLDKILETDDLL
ncbi:MAG: 30S ribosomal protein S6 [Patescibacteria group bacterium]|nr:30S ribosomal protein S6 [Patescibacteria group bacterium]MBU1870769.1 30S ribosomal protein S6 [Patescibacteria group bacterium]